ncbi:MAG: hypothetical protein AAB074_16250 [Planctomycetota bacterium]
MRFLIRTFFLVLALHAPAFAESADKPINLLRKAIAGEEPVPAGLADDNPATVASGPAPLEVVFEFADVVSPEQIVVRIPKGSSAASKVEVLASTVSRDGGFVFVRGDALRVGDIGAQTFPLPVTGARWVMLRFAGQAGSEEAAVADVALMGREGPPRSLYEFSESPAKALEMVAGLKSLTHLKIEITPDETSLFEDAKDGKLDTWTFAEAALLASGATDKARRGEYATRIDALFEDAKKVSEAGKTAAEKGELLLKWLHAGPMKKGYVSNQTDVSVILDSGTFNCVSSAALYNILGRRLGLDLRAIEVPDHAFAIFYDGATHADVETTTAMGFNPSRDQKAVKAFEKQTGFTYIPDKHRAQRREVGETGLVAIIFYNHGVMLSLGKEHLKAILSFFRAMSMDPEFGSAVKNALASLTQWSLELAREGKFAEAAAVIDTGVGLAPGDRTLVHNRKYVWHQWAEAEMKAGREEAAVAVLRDAAAKVPAEAETWNSMQAGLFIKRGEALIKEKQWEKALETGAASRLEDKPREQLDAWRSGVRTRWALSLVKEKAYEKAMELLAANPRDKRTVQNIVFVVQEWAFASSDDDALKILRAQVKRFEDIPGVKKVAAAHPERAIAALIKGGKFEESVACAERFADFLRELSADPDRLLLVAWDGWGQTFLKKKDWSGAAGVYDKALKKLPEEKLFLTNLKYVAQEWSRDAYAKEGEARAKEILQVYAARFPDVAQGHVQWVVATLCKEGRFEEAVGAAGRHKELVKDAAAVARPAYDQWAGSHSKKKEWKEATEVYGRGLKEYPGDKALENNATVAWDNWARTFWPAKDWAGAIRIYDEGLAQLPGSKVLLQNRKYCEDQSKK